MAHFQSLSRLWARAISFFGWVASVGVFQNAIFIRRKILDDRSVVNYLCHGYEIMLEVLLQPHFGEHLTRLIHLASSSNPHTEVSLSHGLQMLSLEIQDIIAMVFPISIEWHILVRMPLYQSAADLDKQNFKMLRCYFNAFT